MNVGGEEENNVLFSKWDTANEAPGEPLLVPN